MFFRLRLAFPVSIAAYVLSSWFAGSASLQAQPAYGNPRVRQITPILSSGARPKFTPNGQNIMFDRRNEDGHYALYFATTAGQIWASLTEGRAPFTRHSGNGIVSPVSSLAVFVAAEPSHYLDQYSSVGQVPIGEPGVGLFNNLWLTDGVNYWKLTNMPVKQTLEDGIPAMATVNPRFTPNGQSLVWTERYDGGGNLNWGLWRLKAADLVLTGPGSPRIDNEHVIYTPVEGTYVTAMDFLSDNELLVSGNLDGQHEFGMDLYRLNLTTGDLTNLTNSPLDWEEGSCVAPSGKIVYMTNRDSQYPLNFAADWVGQLVERDYYIMDGDGSNKERLTYFNVPGTAEYTGWRAVTIICDVSPDGKTIAATVGRDFGDETTSWLHWTVWMIELFNPL